MKTLINSPVYLRHIILKRSTQEHKHFITSDTTRNDSIDLLYNNYHDNTNTNKDLEKLKEIYRVGLKCHLVR